MNRKAFYDAIRPTLGALTIANVDGFERVLDEAGRRGVALNPLASILAQAWWETGKTMQPVREGFYLGDRADAYRRTLRYYPWFGRGLIQTTWEENYRKMSKVVGADLILHPNLLLEWRYALPALFDGMLQGLYTGKALSDYIDDKDEPDDEDLREFIAARRVVNGQDKAAEIGRLSLMFERALKAGGYRGAKPEPEPKGLAALFLAIFSAIARIFRRTP